MFDNLSNRLGQIIQSIKGQARLTEENIQETLREIRIALLEADVALPVVKQFIQDIKERVLGQAVLETLNPAQTLIKLVSDELAHVMGDTNIELALKGSPSVILMAGLQGSGKTTSVAKLGRYIKERLAKSVIVASTDTYRPAAIEQLEKLASEIDVTFYPSNSAEDPVAIAKAALLHAQKHFIDVLIVDTAGRLHIDEEMMVEIKAIHAAISPHETLFVVDSMTGQDAANTAKAFNDTLPLTGVILTKTDGDNRGGAALSVRYITGKPIKFIGVGEKTTALEMFHPERVASRILGMGDIVSLVEEAQHKIDKVAAEKITKKLVKGKDFDLEDFLSQLKQMKNMGGAMGIMTKIPGIKDVPNAALSGVNDKSFGQMEAIIQSMTRKERRFPAHIKGSQKRRIAAGSGTEVQDINRLLKQFTQMQKMLKKFAKPGAMMKMLRGMGGKFPPGGMPGF